MKRSWRQWYVSVNGLAGFELMHHKNREEAMKTSGEQKALLLSLHHALALPLLNQTVAASHSEKGKEAKKATSTNSGHKWDFIVRLADWAQYQYRCRLIALFLPYCWFFSTSGQSVIFSAHRLSAISP